MTDDPRRGVSPHVSTATLYDLADGELSATDEHALESHLATCPACRAEWEAVRDLVRAGRESRRPIPAPDEMWTIVSATTVHERLVRRHILRGMRGTLIVLGLTIAGASAAVSSLVTRAVIRREPSVVQPVPVEMPREPIPQPPTAPVAPGPDRP